MRLIRGDAEGISVIVGALMLTLIVVTAAVSFAVFTAQQQEAIQEAESAKLSRELEKLEVTGISANNSISYTKDSNDSYDNLEFVGFDLFSRHQGKSQITMITLNKYLVRNFTVQRVDRQSQEEFWQMNSNGSYVYGPSEDVDIKANEHVILKIDTFSSFTNWDKNNIEINDPLELRITTKLGNTFSKLFIPPNPVIKVETESRQQNGDTYEVVYLDGEDSSTTGDASIETWNWSITLNNPILKQDYIFADTDNDGNYSDGETVYYRDPNGSAIKASPDVGNSVIVDRYGYSSTVDWLGMNGWDYRKKITIDYDDISPSLTNFPLAVEIVDERLRTNASEDGSDIRFINKTGNTLPYEIELFDKNEGHLVAWVEISNLFENTYFYLYFGNPSASSPPYDVVDIWNNASYDMIYHLHETSGNFNNSAHNTEGALPHQVSRDNLTGKIGLAPRFDGEDNDYINVSGGLPTWNNLSNWTLELWMMPTSHSGYATIIGRDSPTNFGILFNNEDGSFILDEYFTGVPGPTVTKSGLINPSSWNQWNHIVIVRQDDDFNFYINGELLDTLTVQSTKNQYEESEYFFIGKYYNRWLFSGFIDEFRFTSKVLDSNWIKLCYQNQLNLQSFYQMTPSLQQQIPQDALYAVDTAGMVYAFMDEDNDNKVAGEQVISFDPDHNGNVNPQACNDVQGGLYGRAIVTPKPELFTFNNSDSDWTYDTNELLNDDPDQNGIADPSIGTKGGLYIYDVYGEPYLYQDADNNFMYDTGENIVCYDADFDGRDANPSNGNSELDPRFKSDVIGCDATPSYEPFIFDDRVEIGTSWLYDGPNELVTGDADGDDLDYSSYGQWGGVFALDPFGRDYTFIDNGNWYYDAGDLIVSWNADGKGQQATPQIGDNAGLYALTCDGKAFTFKDSNQNMLFGYDATDILFYDPDGDGVDATPHAGEYGGFFAFDDGEESFSGSGIRVSPNFEYLNQEHKIVLTVTDNYGMVGKTELLYNH